MKKLSAEERRAAKVALYDDLEAGRLTIAESVREMRRVTGMTQKEFAERVAGLSTSALAQIERGEGNPTIATLDEIGRAFGLEVGFRRRKRGELPPPR
jgi:transcriptional regulator with XRE-family HTH domain